QWRGFETSPRSESNSKLEGRDDTRLFLRQGDRRFIYAWRIEMRRMAILLLALFSFASIRGSSSGSTDGKASLAERLGYKATDKILIINVDDIGNSHAANAAVIDSMENGLATSATIIVPGPWFPEIAAYAKDHPKADFGVHLAHTSEWKTLKWGPVASKSEVPGLIDPQGYLWP